MARCCDRGLIWLGRVKYFMTVGERWQYAALPLEWSDSGSYYTSMGVVGFVKSGAVVYDHRSDIDGSLAVYWEWDSLDPYHGHASANDQYHYHAVSKLCFETKCTKLYSKILSVKSSENLFVFY